MMVLAIGVLAGFASPDMGVTLELNVEWVKGFTGHEDGIKILAEGAGAGAAKELIEKATAEVKKEIDAQTKELREELKKNLDAQILELDTRIKAGENAGTGVAELKEESSKRSEANAALVTKIEDMVKSHADGLNAKLAELQNIAPKGAPADFVDYGVGIADAVKAAQVGASTSGKRVGFKYDGMLPHHLRRKDVSVTGSTVYEPLYVPGIIGPGERQLRVRDLLPRNRTSQNQVFYISETALTDNAGPQTGLGITKGETTFQITVASETVRTLAHFIQIPLQLLDDIPGLEDYTNGRMMFLLDQEEEDQLLYGNNVGQNLNGLITQATAYDTTLTTDLGVSNVTDIDRLRAAIAQVHVAEYPTTGIVMHTYNWASIELEKDSQGRYIFAQPQNSATPRMWGLPVVATTGIQSPDFLVGAFQLGAAIWDRQEGNIMISTEDSDNFQKNMATLRAEERICLTVYRTASFVQGDFDATIT